MYSTRHPFDYNYTMMDNCFGWLGFLMMLLIWGAIIGVAIYLIRTLANRSNTNSAHRDPLDIARERYAKGEITKEELADIKKELSSKG
jgi:putative membrane protein